MAFIRTDQAPDQQAAEDVQRSGPLKTLASTAVSFLAYGLGMKALSTVSFKANLGIGKFLTKIAQPKSEFNASFTKAVSQLKYTSSREQIHNLNAVNKSVRSLFISTRRAINGASKTLEQAARPNIEHGRYFNSMIKRDMTKYGSGKDIRATSILTHERGLLGRIKLRNGKTFGSALSKMRGDVEYSQANSQQGIMGTLKLLRNPPKNIDVGRAIRGKAYGYGTYLSSFAAADYAMYNLTMPSDKKWYDPRKMGEWAAFTLATDLPMRNAIPNAKKAMGFISDKLAKGLQKNNIGKSIVDYAIPKLAELGNNTRFKAFGESLDKLGTHNNGNHQSLEAIRRMSAFSDEYANARLRISRESRLQQTPKIQSDYTEQLKVIDESLGNESNAQKKLTAYQSAKGVSDIADPNKWTKSINKLFGTNLKSSTTSITHPADEKISKMIFRGEGHLSNNGKDYDLSNIMPAKIGKSLFNFAHENINILGFKPLSLLNIKPILDSKKAAFSLYNSDSKEMVSIGVAPNKQAIEAKLDIISANKNNMLDELLKVSDATKNIDNHFEALMNGKIGTPKQREIYASLAEQETHLTSQKEWIDSMMAIRGDVKNNPGAFQQDLERGFVKLKNEEYVQVIGGDAYFGFRNTKGQMQVNKLGYDVNTGDYHNFINVQAEHAGGLMKVLSGMRGYDASKNLGGISQATSKSRVNPADNAFKKIIMGLGDMFEIGNSTEKSIFGTVTDFFTKQYHVKTFKNIVNATHNNPLFLNNLGRDEVHTFNKVLQTKTKEMNVFLSNEFFNNAAFVSDASAFARKTSSVDFFKSGDFFISEKPHLSTAAYNTEIKDKANKLSEALTQLHDPKTSPIPVDIDDQMQFLNKIINHSDPTSLLGLQYQKNLKYKDVFNSLSFRTFHGFLNMEQKDQLISTLQNGLMSSRMKKNAKFLNMSSTINAYENVDLNKLDEAQSLYLGQRVVGQLNKDYGMVKRFANEIEPIYRDSGLHDNLEYPNERYTPANLLLSTNKNDKGESIYSFTEQLLGRRKFDINGEYELPVTSTALFASQALNAINNTARMVGLGFKQDSTRTVASFGKDVLFKRVLPAVALAQAYQAGDAFFDESKIFDGTALGEGLTVFGANMLAQGSLAIANINDSLGISGGAKYMEDLMPGSVNSPLAHAVRGFGSPLAGMALGAKFAGPGGALIGGSIGAAVSLLTSGGPLGAFAKFDITKSRNDLIEEYAGRRKVPVYKGAGWLLSPTPIGGSKIDYFDSSWFHKIQSQHKYTDVLFGGKFERLLSGLDYNHYGEKQEFSRPYPTAQRMFSDIPLIGQTMGVGGGIQDEESLKFATYANALSGGESINLAGVGLNPTGGVSGYNGQMPGQQVMSAFGPAYTTENGFGGTSMQQNAVLPGSMISRMNYGSKQIMDFAGMRGFLTSTAFESMNNGMLPYEDVPKLESASWMTSPARAYWDANLGDLGGMNEFIRRFIPKHGQDINDVNPLPAMGTPDWLAHSNNLKDLSKGDIYTKIARGESRLPGAGYEAQNAVNFDFPLETKYMGRSFENVLAMMTGNYMPTSEDEKYDFILGGKMAQRVKESLSLSNQNVTEGKMLFDPRLNLSGKVDMFINGVATKTKVVSDKSFRSGVPDNFQHKSEMNALLMMSGGNVGSIMYINAETGETKNMTVQKNDSRYFEDLSNLTKSKLVAKNLVDQNGPSIGINMGNAYSRLDRLKILGDVSPYSSEFQSTLQQVRTQSKLGMLTAQEQLDLDEVMGQRDKVMQRYVVTDYKFNRGTAITPEEKEFQSSIKSEYSLMERTIGSVWEGFAHQDTMLQKGLNIGSAREQYERYELYGMQMRNWETPYQSFVRPYATSFLSKDTAFGGASAGGTAGFIFGGPGAAALGTLVGGIYGGTNSAFGFGKVPGYRENERDLNEQLDRIRYEKAKAAFDATGALEAKEEMSRTMTYQYQNASTIRGLFAASPKHERSFIRDFAQVGSLEEREKIMEIMPEYIKPVLDKAWTGKNIDINDPALRFMDDPSMKPSNEWSGWNANVSTDDIAVKFYDNAGLDAHNAGLGWQDQMRKMKYKSGIPDSFSQTMDKSTLGDDIKNIVQSVIKGSFVSVMPTGSNGISINLT